MQTNGSCGQNGRVRKQVMQASGSCKQVGHARGSYMQISYEWRSWKRVMQTSGYARKWALQASWPFKEAYHASKQIIQATWQCKKHTTQGKSQETNHASKRTLQVEASYKRADNAIKPIGHAMKTATQASGSCVDLERLRLWGWKACWTRRSVRMHLQHKDKITSRVKGVSERQRSGTARGSLALSPLPLSLLSFSSFFSFSFLRIFLPFSCTFFVLFPFLSILSLFFVQFLSNSFIFWFRIRFVIFVVIIYLSLSFFIIITISYNISSLLPFPLSLSPSPSFLIPRFYFLFISIFLSLCVFMSFVFFPFHLSSLDAFLSFWFHLISFHLYQREREGKR